MHVDISTSTFNLAVSTLTCVLVSPFTHLLLLLPTSIMSSEQRSKAIDLSHHISDFARSYAPSPFRSLDKYWDNGLIPFSSGYPSADYFPFTSVSADGLPADAFPLTAPRATSPSPSSQFGWFWRLFAAGKDSATHVEVPHKPRPGDGELNLTDALQYGPAIGFKRTQEFIRELTERIYSPAYDDWTHVVDTGTTDGWDRIAKMLLNPGDTLLVEEWTYPAALASARPIGVRWKAVPMDTQGMLPDALRAILAGWDVGMDGPRPRVIYTVPVGQNPTGITTGGRRKKAIYDICVEYDLIIAEDDPYFFLQIGEYVPKSQRKAKGEPTEDGDVASFVASLVPTYLKFDTQGRVIRMDTFSKITAPGVRLGWITCNPVFAERFERIGEVSTHCPCGLGQALLMGLITQWTFDGYVRWLRGLRAQYRHRRDFFVDCLAEEFDLLPAPASAVHGAWAADDHAVVLSAYPRGSALKEKTRPLLSFAPPSSGMYVWMQLHFGDVPDKTDEKSGSVLTPDRQFFDRLAEAGVLVAPGWIFSPLEKQVLSMGADRQIGHVRLSYTPADMEQTRQGVKIFAQTLREFYRV